jgi:hypothetical protein
MADDPQRGVRRESTTPREQPVLSPAYLAKILMIGMIAGNILNLENISGDPRPYGRSAKAPTM